MAQLSHRRYLAHRGRLSAVGRPMILVVAVKRSKGPWLATPPGWQTLKKDPKLPHAVRYHNGTIGVLVSYEEDGRMGQDYLHISCSVPVGLPTEEQLAEVQLAFIDGRPILEGPFTGSLGRSVHWYVKTPSSSA